MSNYMSMDKYPRHIDAVQMDDHITVSQISVMNAGFIVEYK